MVLDSHRSSSVGRDQEKSSVRLLFSITNFSQPATSPHQCISMFRSLCFASLPSPPPLSLRFRLVFFHQWRSLQILREVRRVDKEMLRTFFFTKASELRHPPPHMRSHSGQVKLWPHHLMCLSKHRHFFKCQGPSCCLGAMDCLTAFVRCFLLPLRHFHHNAQRVPFHQIGDQRQRANQIVVLSSVWCRFCREDNTIPRRTLPPAG